MKRSELFVFPLLFFLALIFLWPVTLGGQTLIPADNLFAFPPWRAFAAQFDVRVPHNELLSDLLLENYAWKNFIVESLRQGQLPLWNPYLFTGLPFLAAGQHSALYPFSILFYLFPIEAAFGWFVALQLALAGSAMYLFARVLRLSPLPALLAALTYQFSGFFLVSLVFPMVISAACWLPLLLLCEEKIVQHGRQTAPNARTLAAWVLIGAVVLGVSFLAGHVEIAYYNLLVMAFYALWRIISTHGWRPRRALAPTLIALVALVTLGITLAAGQVVPLYELVSRSFRQGSQDYATIVGYAFPARQVITFFVPDFFGNPAHHGYIDLVTRVYVPITQDVAGRPINTIFWGVKNYVEAGSYLGILPLLLALIAVSASTRMLLARRAAAESHITLLFAALALISLLFVFGTPLYALLFYGLPGFSQLHSPFRWVYPYTLAVAMLAGLGAQQLSARTDRSRLWGWLPFGLGAMLLVVLGVALVMPAPFVAIAERVLRGSDMAQRAFPDARAFFSYEALNLAKFALVLMSAGAVLWLARRTIYLPARFKHVALWKPLAALLVVADLFLFGFGFYPAADPQFLRFTPPAVKFLQADSSLFRITTLDAPGDKTFNANLGMLYGIQDMRGYDSIIPKQYADWMGLIEGQGELLYNRIAPFYWRGSLDSALLDLANVKYVLTTQTIDNPKFTRVYDDDINIYRNERVLPRAFVVHAQRPLVNLDELKSLDPRALVLLDGGPAAATSAACTSGDASVLKYGANEVTVRAETACDGWLVLADAYFPGWQAFDKLGDAPERETQILRADGNFRAVPLAAGQHVIRFKYNPLSLRVGSYLSFFAAMALLLLGGYWAWGKLYRAETHEREARRVLKNSALPMATALLNKAIDTLFAAFMLRVLGPENAGKYAFAIVIIAYCDIFINFGLSTLVTRDVSRDRALANRYLSNTTILRMILLLVLTPLLALCLWVYRSFFGLSDDVTFAIVLLAVSLIPSGIASALSSIFYAYEMMEYPAAITVVTTLLKVTVGVIVLLAGLGFVGLAGANVFINLATLAMLLVLFVRKFFVPRLEFDPRFERSMLRTSYPLMLNDMLSRAFNRVDVLLLQPLRGNTVVGWYTTSYKYLDGLNILPSTFTIALFPVLSRYAAGAPDALMRAYLKSMKYLVILAMPLMVLSFVYADFIILLFGGPEYLPEAAIALRLIIGFLPLSFINNVTHYVLIAVNQQKYLTKAFIVGALFNVIANLIFIPLFSYRAAAVITIFSELALLIPFYVGIRRHVGRVDWLALLWRPVLATGTMGLLIAMLDGVLRGWWTLALIPLSLLVYAFTLAVTGTFDADDHETLALLMPARFKRARPAAPPAAAPGE